ncbi:MAG: tetratricopeptide repeat protein, partial [Xanthomonadales bacterium]|nr:tetratricopeptide repeat protein [Xanthomonadales bacterium]
MKGWQRCLGLTGLIFLTACGEPTPQPLSEITGLDPGHIAPAVQSHLDEAQRGVTAARRKGDKAMAWAQLAQVYQAYGINSVAVVAYQNALSLMPDQNRWRYLLGHAYLALDRHEEALSAFEVCIVEADVLPRDRELLALAHRAAAESLLVTGQLEEARRHATDTLKLAPADPHAWHVLARIEGAAGRAREAVDAYERVRRLAPSADRIYARMSQLVRQLGDPARAASLAQRTGERAVPRTDGLLAAVYGLKRGPDADIGRGLQAFQEGDYARAAAAYDRALTDAPENAAALLGLAAARLKLNDGAGAEDLMLTLTRLQPR